MLPAKHVCSAFRGFGETVTEPMAQQMLAARNGFAESLFERLGAESVESIDHSSYEQATHVLDMNDPIEERLKEKYSVVFDGGSLEHVFNFPVAIKNCMEMVEVGGHYLSITPANNMMGHGFYQFSPELMFRVFAKENGYEVCDVLFVEEGLVDRWYRVSDPVQVRSRVKLANRGLANLFVLAKRVAKTPIFEKWPQQSDYVALWSAEGEVGGSSQPSPNPVAQFLKNLLPTPAKFALTKTYQRYFDYGRNPRHFAPFTPESIQAKSRR